MPEPIISVRHLSKRYHLGAMVHDTLRDHIAQGFRSMRQLLGGNNGSPQPNGSANILWALRDVSFDVQPGEVVGIIGRNGAGKSTFLKILSQISEPTSGEVRIRGRVASLLEVGTGFHPELSGRENIFLNGAILGMSKAEIRRKFDEIVAFSEVEKFLDTPVKRYSSGMYVRLAFAVAAHLEPEVLVVDEVLAVGDMAFQQKCLGKMQDVAQQEGRTVLFVSHNMAAVQKLCSRGILLKDGQLDYDGEPERCIARYRDTAWNPEDNACFMLRRELLRAPANASIRVTDIQMLDGSGQPLTVLRSTDSLTFRIRYRAQSDFLRSPVAFIVSIKTHLGQEICRFSTMPISGFRIDALWEEGCVDLRLESLPLTAGKYMVDVRLSRPNVDWLVKLDDVVAFLVEGKDVYNSGMFVDQSRGVIVLPHQWSHRAAPDA